MAKVSSMIKIGPDYKSKPTETKNLSEKSNRVQYLLMVSYLESILKSDPDGFSNTSKSNEFTEAIK